MPGSAVAPGSESEVVDGLVERSAGHLYTFRQLLLVDPGEEAVDHAVVIADQPFLGVGQPHVLEALGMKTELLLRQIAEVLDRNRWPARIVRRHRFRRTRDRPFRAFRVEAQRIKLEQAALRPERTDTV